MTRSQATRSNAAYLLALTASGQGETLSEVASQVGLDRPAVQLALAALRASLSAGNWRTQRAEAEAKIRTGWTP